MPPGGGEVCRGKDQARRRMRDFTRRVGRLKEEMRFSRHLMLSKQKSYGGRLSINHSRLDDEIYVGSAAYFKMSGMKRFWNLIERAEE